MSVAAKATLAASIVTTSVVIWGVWRLQVLEADVRGSAETRSAARALLRALSLCRFPCAYDEQTMYKGVVRDAERRAEKLARAKELEEQAIRRAYLEQSQPVSRPSGPAPALPPGVRASDISSADVRFDACKTC